MTRLNFLFFLVLMGSISNIHAQDDKASTTQQQTPIMETQQAVQEYAENYVFADPKQRKAFLELTAVLRCPKCQNQNIADSDAPIAHDMRRKVYQLMQEGSDKTQVVDWMKQRYGDFVYYQPPVNPVTIWLWLSPILFAGIMLIFFIKRRKVVDDADTQAKIALADKLLKEE